jgi:amino acid transporter
VLERSLGLGGAVTLNMLDMIGVGPFITIPLLLSAMGGPQAMLGWILGALLAVCDGLVWAELGAAMPEAGGSYYFLRRIYGDEGGAKVGRYVAFLFIFQLAFSAPLSAASGCIGLSQYAAFLWPKLAGNAVAHTIQIGPYSAGIQTGLGTAVAIAVVVLAVALLYRRLASVGFAARAMWCAVMVLIVWILVTGVLRGHISQAISFPPDAFRLTPAFFHGLAAAMLIATYDYWGYYNITFLGGEVRDAGRTMPRAILISIAIVGTMYLGMTLAVLSVVPWQQVMGAQDLTARRAVIAVFMQIAYGPQWGPWLARVAAVLVMVAAFGSVFSLLLGYSRIPYAAARDGNFFRVFGRLHRDGFPNVSLLWLGAAAAGFCFFSLGDVIAALVIVRIVLQFLLQHIGVMLLRRSQPEMKRPFRIWLYPLPPLLAIAGFAYILFARASAARELILAAMLIVLGSGAFLLREARVTGK